MIAKLGDNDKFRRLKKAYVENINMVTMNLIFWDGDDGLGNNLTRLYNG